MRKLTVLFLILLCAGWLKAEDEGNINPNIKLNFDERFRMVSSDNLFSLDNTADGGWVYTRHRSRLTGSYFPSDKFQFNLRITNEFWNTSVPEGRGFDFNEVVIEWLNVKLSTKEFLDGSLTVGRQNIMLGEGFVMLDGTPHDGSRTAYFNGVRFDWTPKSHQTLTAFYVYQEKEDSLLPVIHSRHKTLNYQDCRGFGLYYKGRVLNDKMLSLYYIGKFTDSSSLKAIESNIHTIGTAVEIPLYHNVKFTAEGAYQFGTSGDYDRSAFGGYSYLKYITGKSGYYPAWLKIGGIFLSGDNWATNNNEGWDPVFGEWPKWSESYIYTLNNENEVAYWTNLASIFGETYFEFNKDVNFDLTYHHLMSPRYFYNGNDIFSGTGRTRGNLLIGKLKFNLTKKLNGHILWENFTPGDFYFDGADSYNWIRTELFLKIG